jgi:hypothetical protein
LAKIALEHFNEGEAVNYLEKAITDSEEGEEVWVAAQVLLANTLVQIHGDAGRIVDAASKALAFLPLADEWTTILKGFVARYDSQPSERSRVVN